MRDLPSPEQWAAREFACHCYEETERCEECYDKIESFARGRREVFKWFVEEVLPEAWDRGSDVCMKERCWKHVDSFNCYEHLEAELRKILDEQGGNDG